MTREEILQAFDDINFVYNDCTRYDTLKRMLEELTERKRGEWIPHPLEKGGMSIDRDVCSICGVQFADAWMFDYCPICGSYMRGDTDDKG